jgi:hypothetical protein
MSSQQVSQQVRVGHVSVRESAYKIDTTPLVSLLLVMPEMRTKTRKVRIISITASVK